jgi:hypothetical protein
MSTPTVRCGDCKFFTDDFPDLRQDDERDDPKMGSLGRCTAMDGAPLPYTWRWCAREVVGAWSMERIQCPRFELLAITEEGSTDAQS